MSKKQSAVFYRNGYYLFPDEVSSLEEFKRSLASSRIVCLRSLSENCRVNSFTVEKGICIAPYFYNEYSFQECNVEIYNLSELYPVEIELLSQKEYNERLRSVVLAYCPGCCRYKALSNRAQSLNGHFEEIALNSVCFYRQEKKPSPRVFRENLWFLGGFWNHFDPCNMQPSGVVDSIKSRLYLKYDSACFDEKNPVQLAVSFNQDFFPCTLTEALNEYIEKKLTFTDFRLNIPKKTYVNVDMIRHQLSESNKEDFRKNCKKYGVALAKLQYDHAFETHVKNSVYSLFEDFYAVPLCEEPGIMHLLVLDECGFLKGLHFRTPVLENAGSEISVYDQYNDKKFRICFDMSLI